MNALEAITSRRSREASLSPEPSREMIELLLDAAVHAPNHHRTHPWRFYVVRGRAREEFGQVCAAALANKLHGMSTSATKTLLLAERRKPLRAPVVLVVGCKFTPNSRHVWVEEVQACAAAIQNILLAAHSLGLAARWRTGSAAYDPLVKQHFGLSPEDSIAGVVYVGFAASEPQTDSERKPPQFAHLTQWLD